MYAHMQFHIAQNLSYLVIYTLILYDLHFEKKEMLVLKYHYKRNIRIIIKKDTSCYFRNKRQRSSFTQCFKKPLMKF